MTAEKAQEQPVDDRREAIVAALETVQSANETKTAPGAPEKPIEAKTEKPRAPDGKFAKSETQAQERPIETAAEKKAREYPSTWKKDYEPTYRKLEANPEYSSVLDEIERRENDMRRGIEQYKSKADFAERFQKTLQPYEGTFQQLGMTPDVAIQRLLAADQAIRSAPPHMKQQMAAQLLRGYGIDPSGVSAEPAQVDPNQQFLMSRLQEIEHQNKTLLSSFEQQMQSEADAQVAAFKKDRPHFDEVREEMGRLIQAGIVQSLPDAYERAIYSLPATREKVLAEQQAKAEAERKQKAQAEAERAKTASVQVKGAPRGSAQSAGSKPKDRRAFIAEQFGETH